VLQDTDWEDNCPGGNTCSVRASNASQCADACVEMRNCVATSWNADKDKCCNFKCSTTHRVHLQGEQGIVVRRGVDLCGTPPPPPPPVGPAQLCPTDSIPSDWLQPCLSAELFFEPATGPQQDPSLLPEVGNGHVAWKVQSDTVYAAGLFNGPAGSVVEADGNSRARIQPFGVTFDLGPRNELVPLGQALDVRRAMFLARAATADGKVMVEQRWYAPLHMPRVIMHEIAITAGGSAVQVSFNGSWIGGASSDLTLAPFSPEPIVVGMSGTNNVPELSSMPRTRVAVAASVPPTQLEVSPGDTTTVYNVQAFVTGLNSSDVEGDAVHALKAAKASIATVQTDHEAAWAARSAAGGGLEVEGDLRLAQALNASLYFIRSSIRPDWPHGLSPGGLASNGYGGHTFWDQETWMWPPLLMMDPPSAASALQYRYDRIPYAQNKSRGCGQQGRDQPADGVVHAWCPPSFAANPPIDGIMFPWESAVTGTEVQLTRGVCGPWCKYEQHITADIAFAVRQYYYQTGDQAWLKEIGWPLLSGIADFYAARVEPANGGGFDLNMVMGPDEFAWPVNNSAYTNAVVRIALEFAVDVGQLLRLPTKAAWADVAAGLKIPFEPTVPNHPELKGGYHPEYDNFPAKTVKQADTVMLNFPLAIPMAPEVLANDLEFYTEITSQTGPAMTWAIFAIDWMDVALAPGNAWSGNFSRAAAYFNKGYANVQRPFNVWRETPNGGAVNFITGAGGFLQSALFGSSGMRLTNRSLTFNPPPPSASGGAATSTAIRVSYRGSVLSRKVVSSSKGDIVVTELLSASRGAPPLSLVDLTSTPPATTVLKIGAPIVLLRGKAEITFE